MRVQAPKPSSGNAFDDILYNSDSDLSDSGSDDEPVRGGQGGQKGRKQPKTILKKRTEERGSAYIRNEGDEPMDLLSRSIAGGVASELSAPSLSQCIR